jgi:hypothetical protein
LRPILVSIAVIVASIELLTVFDHLIERPVLLIRPLIESDIPYSKPPSGTNSHGQAEALLDGSNMLGIGYVDAGIDEETSGRAFCK